MPRKEQKFHQEIPQEPQTLTPYSRDERGGGGLLWEPTRVSEKIGKLFSLVRVRLRKLVGVYTVEAITSCGVEQGRAQKVLLIALDLLEKV